MKTNKMTMIAILLLSFMSAATFVKFVQPTQKIVAEDESSASDEDEDTEYC